MRTDDKHTQSKLERRFHELVTEPELMPLLPVHPMNDEIPTLKSNISGRGTGFTLAMLCTVEV